MENSTSFSLGKAGRTVMKKSGLTLASDPLEVIRQCITADILECLKPFRFFPKQIDDAKSTTEGSILMLFGWLDQELRQDLRRTVGDTGIVRYLVPQIAIHLLVDNVKQMSGVRPISFGELGRIKGRITELAVNYVRTEQAQVLKDASSATVDARIHNGQRIQINTSPIRTNYGTYSHLLFYRVWVQYPFDDDDLLPEFKDYLASRTLAQRYEQVSQEMRKAFGYGLEALLWLLTGTFRELMTLPGNAIVIRKNQVLDASTAPQGINSDELERALRALTLKPKDTIRRRFTEATGFEERLGLTPFFELDDNQLVTAPSLLSSAATSIFRNITYGRLPSGRPAKEGNSLFAALGNSRRIWTEDIFEESVRSEFRKAGFPCVEVPKGQIAERQIDCVVASPLDRKIWVISVKDLLAALRPKQQMEQLERFFEEYIPQLEDNVRDVALHLEEILNMLAAQADDYESLSNVSNWGTVGMFVTRELPPLAGLEAPTRALPSFLLRRQICQLQSPVWPIDK